MGHVRFRFSITHNLYPITIIQTVCYTFAKAFVAMSDPSAENLHAGNLEYDKVNRRKVNETKENEEGGTEVEGKHAVPLHQLE